MVQTTRLKDFPLSADIRTIEQNIPMPLMKLPVVTPVVRLSHGLVLFSPGPSIPDAKTELETWGPVADIVAPNLLHHMYFPRAVRTFPQAKRWGVRGFDKKRPDIQWTHTLTEESWAYGDELPAYEIKGIPAFNETAFFHKASRTLICSDLCFNLLNAQGLGARLILSLFGTYRRFGVSRLFLRSVKDRSAFTESIGRVLSLEIEAVIMSHGTPLLRGGRQCLQASFQERGYLR